MRIEVYQPGQHRNLWEEFVGRRARNSHFMHLRRYIEYHGDRFEDHSLLFFGSRPEPVAVLPAHRQGDVLVSHGGLSFGGLLVGRRFRLGHWREAFAAIGVHMIHHGMGALHYRPVPHWYQRAPGEEDVFLLEEAGERAELLASSICRMDGEFSGNKNRRRESRSAVEVGRDDGSLPELMELVGETLRVRHAAVPVHTLSEIAYLAEQFPGAIRCYTARAGELVAGLVLFASETVVKLQYVGYAQGAAMSSIYAHLFQLEEFRGRWFDFGTSMGDGEQLDEGLFAYKESLGGRLATARLYKIVAGSPALLP